MGRTYYRTIASRTELEREYSPSSLVPDLPAILQTYRELSRSVCDGNRQWTIRSYGEDPAEYLNYFVPAQPNAEAGWPLIVYIHGGYWQELSAADHVFPAPGFCRRGIAYASINYGLAPEASMDIMVERCRTAMVWLIRNAAALGHDPTRIIIAGCSAGGHLAAMTMLTNWSDHGLPATSIAGVILMSGVFDLRPIPLTYVNDAVGMTSEDALRNSPALLADYADADIPPVLIVYADNETAEFKRQSEEFCQILKRRGVAANVFCIAERNHFDLIFDLAEPTTPFGGLAAQFISAGETIRTDEE